MSREWGKGADIMKVYKYIHKLHKSRMGSCDWLPEDGDLCVCVSHSGDCFNYYMVIRKQEGGLYKSVGEFGAYKFAEPIGEITKKGLHFLQAGAWINFKEVTRCL